MVNYSEKDYGYFGKCLEISNNVMEMLVTLDVGPRIISYKLVGKENIMCEDKDENSTMEGGEFAKVFGDKKWYIYGGHRLWFSPEDDPRSYYPDNDRVEYKIHKNTVIFTPPCQFENQLQFEIQLTFDDLTAEVKVSHKITNLSNEKVKIAPWALTVLDKNAVALLPQSVKDKGLLSNRNISLWSYTDVYDNRLFIGNKYITVKQDSYCDKKLKVGLNNEDGWIAALVKGQFFVKRFDYLEKAEYPDHHCNCECFTNFFMIEVESLGELKSLNKGESVFHDEWWNLFACNETFDNRNEESVETFLSHQIMPI